MENSLKHIMVDIETMGISANAAILSIGACYFDPTTGQLGETFHAKVEFDGAMGEADMSTVLWWLRQSEEARKELLSGSRDTLDDVLRQFRSFCRNGEGIEGFWSNGPTFDEIILQGAFKRREIRWPISYRASRCCRTILAIGEAKKIPRLVQEGVKHDALADAIHQAKSVSHIYDKGGLR